MDWTNGGRICLHKGSKHSASSHYSSLQLLYSLTTWHFSPKKLKPTLPIKEIHESKIPLKDEPLCLLLQVMHNAHNVCVSDKLNASWRLRICTVMRESCYQSWRQLEVSFRWRSVCCACNMAFDLQKNSQKKLSGNKKLKEPQKHIQSLNPPQLCMISLNYEWIMLSN